MFRRLRLLALLAAVLFGQWAGMCRCVGGCDAAGRNSRPHVHLDALIPLPVQSAGCGCKKRAAAGNDAAGPSHGPATSDAAGPTHLPLDGGRHDIVYLSPEMASGLWVNIAGDDTRRGCDPSGALPNSCSVEACPAARLQAVAARLSKPHSPCPVYLRKLSLLI